MIAAFPKTVAWTWLASLLALNVAAAGEVAWRGPEIAGHLPAGILEASGLAVSRRAPGMFWTHGDSGGAPVVEAIAADGTLRGAVRIAGVKNVDWEDIASFELDGKAWLLIADTGDNNSRRNGCALYVVPEPDPAELQAGAECVVAVNWKIPVHYPDGPRDCEAVAVDAKEELVYLLAKRVTPHGIYVLPLRPAAAGEAERVGEMPAFPEAPEPRRLLPIPSGRYRPQPTGMDFAADGSAAVVVTYGDVLVYPRAPGERWADALAKTPETLAPHGLPQAEAVAFGAEAGEIFVTSEGAGAPLLRYRRDEAR